MASPFSAIRFFEKRLSGAYGLSRSSEPATYGDCGIEQRGQRAQNAGFGLAAQAEQNEVMAREHGVHDLRDDRIFIADDAGEERILGFGGRAQAGDQVIAELVFDGAADALRGIHGGAEFAEGGGERGGGRHDSSIDFGSAHILWVRGGRCGWRFAGAKDRPAFVGGTDKRL